jgi:metal-responsive CopG/Arc/MetJ family transcriptional regulator
MGKHINHKNITLTVHKNLHAEINDFFNKTGKNKSKVIKKLLLDFIINNGGKITWQEKQSKEMQNR